MDYVHAPPFTYMPINSDSGRLMSKILREERADLCTSLASAETHNMVSVVEQAATIKRNLNLAIGTLPDPNTRDEGIPCYDGITFLNGFEGNTHRIAGQYKDEFVVVRPPNFPGLNATNCNCTSAPNFQPVVTPNPDHAGETLLGATATARGLPRHSLQQVLAGIEPAMPALEARSFRARLLRA